MTAISRLTCFGFALLLLGAGLLMGSLWRPALAADSLSGPRQYRECFGATLYTVSGRNLSNGQLPDKLVKIPMGWQPVGGGGPTSSNQPPYVILCR